MAEKAAKGKTVDCLATCVTDFLSVMDLASADVQLSYVTEKLDAPPVQMSDAYQDGRKRPFAVFEFRYRTRGDSCMTFSVSTSQERY